jgi:hypothetical protein
VPLLFGVGVKVLIKRSLFNPGAPSKGGTEDESKRDDYGSYCEHVCASQCDMVRVALGFAD